MRKLVLTLSVLLACLSCATQAAPVAGPLLDDEITIANQLLNAIIRGDAVAEGDRMVVELLHDAKPQIVAALQEAGIAGDVEVRAGTFLSGFIPAGPGLYGSRHLNLTIYQSGKRLGELNVGKSYESSFIIPYAQFTR